MRRSDLRHALRGLLKRCDEGAFARGTYFLTVKSKDGANDSGSMLDRDGVFRLNMGLPKADYVTLFGPPPCDAPRRASATSRLRRNGRWPHDSTTWCGRKREVKRASAILARFSKSLAVCPLRVPFGPERLTISRCHAPSSRTAAAVAAPW